MSTYVRHRLQQPSIKDAVKLASEIGFGTITAHANGEFFVSHVPIHVEQGDEDSAIELRFHVFARNPLADVLSEGSEPLVVFRGPDGYISPTWYDHENVPTWDYAFVHMTGHATPLEDSALRAHIQELIRQFEPDLELSDELIDKQLPAIRGFAIHAPAVEPIYKLSQDKNPQSIDGVIAGLRRRGQWLDTELARQIDLIRQD